MDNQQLKQRAFILSSFTRNKITLCTNIYRFADYIIESGWLPTLNDLDIIDQEILKKYNDFIKNK
jgi:hypothetical protein